MWDKFKLNSALVIQIITLIFIFGISYANIRGSQVQIEKDILMLKQESARKDVLIQQFAGITSDLKSISDRLTRIEASLDKQRR